MWSLKNYITIAFNMDHMRVKGKTTKRNKKTTGYCRPIILFWENLKKNVSFISYHKTDILDKPNKMIIIVPFV